MFPVAGPWTGRLGIVPRPRGGDWLADEAIAWRDAGINMVVSNVVAHCRQGIGRSSMIVAATLVTGGMDLIDALKTIKKSRGLDVPETDEQRRWLTAFASWCDAAPAIRRNA